MGMFTDILLGMRQGGGDRLASELLTQVGEAVLRTGKKGSVTVKIGIEMLKDGENETKVTIDVAHKIPTEGLPAGIYYLDDKGGLHRADPRQLDMIEKAREAGDGKVTEIPRHTQL